MLAKTAIVGVPKLCEKCGHCHDVDSPCLKSASIEETEDLNLEVASKEDLAVREKEN